MNNTYIQNKLDEFDKLRYKDGYSDTDGFDLGYDGFHIERIKNWIKQALTDYHNHIVENLNRSIYGCDWVDIEDGKGRYVNEKQLAKNIIANTGILQDTNQKE